GIARLALETPVVARGGDRFVIRSYSPVTTVGGGAVIDPYPPAAPQRLRQRRLSLDAVPGGRLAGWGRGARLPRLPVADLPVRLGIRPDQVEDVIADAGKHVLQTAGRLVWRAAAAREAERLQSVLEAHHGSHPLDTGMSLQALRSSIGGGAELAEE